jgi:predicted  nucleic acid-binding Zn-ribbon protein
MSEGEAIGLRAALAETGREVGRLTSKLASARVKLRAARAEAKAATRAKAAAVVDRDRMQAECARLEWFAQDATARTAEARAEAEKAKADAKAARDCCARGDESVQRNIDLRLAAEDAMRKARDSELQVRNSWNGLKATWERAMADVQAERDRARGRVKQLEQFIEANSLRAPAVDPGNGPG